MDRKIINFESNKKRNNLEIPSFFEPEEYGSGIFERYDEIMERMKGINIEKWDGQKLPQDVWANTSKLYVDTSRFIKELDKEITKKPSMQLREMRDEISNINGLLRIINSEEREDDVWM